MATDSLPNYKQPPVAETVLGVQFEPIATLKHAHLGAFWQSLGSEWKKLQEASAIEPQFEKFTESSRWGSPRLQLKLADIPPLRVQIKNESDDRMIQIQNGRFHFNWIGEQGGAYPRYEAVSQDFFLYLDRFKKFLNELEPEDFKPNQWEVTYVNHIPKGTVWNETSDWSFYRLLGECADPAGLTELESFGGEWHFVIPQNRGRLHVKWQHGHKSKPEEAELIVLTLTARGPLDNSNDDVSDLKDCLNLGHEVIVRSFRSLMTDSANNYWGLENENT